MAMVLMLALGMTALAAQQTAKSEDSLAKVFQAAVGHYDSGQYGEAVKALEGLVKQLPSSFEVYELLGLAYAAESEIAKANPFFEKAVALKPGSSAARANLAVNLARLGKKQQAEVEFKKAISIAPEDYEANHDFGEFYAHEGCIAEAVPYLKKAQLARPDAFGNGYDLALAYEKTEQYDAARRELENLIQKNDSAELHNLLGEVEEKNGNFLAAAREYQQAAQMDPSETNIFDWGSEFLLHHTWNAAVKVFSQGVRRYPNSSSLAVGLGMAYYWSGEYKLAVKTLMRATDLAPADPHPYYFLNRAYKKAPGEEPEVIARFRRFEELRPNDAQAAYYYAVGLWKEKEMESPRADLGQVEALFKKAVQLNPSYAEAHMELGDFYSRERRYADAVPEYQRALQLDPNLPEAYYSLGQAYVHLGKKDLAQKEFAEHQKFYANHLAEDDRERERIRQFVYSVESGHSGQQQGRSMQ